MNHFLEIMMQQNKCFQRRYNFTIFFFELTQGNHFYRLLKNATTSYRALDLENDIVGGSHIEGFPISAIPVLTKHDRGRSTVMAESNEEKKNVD